MKKGTKNVVIVLLLILAIVGGLYSFSITGTSSLSLDQVDLRSSYAPLNGDKAWLYTFTVGRLSQQLIGQVSADQAADVYDGSERPTEDFRMDVLVDTQECRYPIGVDSNADPIYDIFLADNYLAYGGLSRCQAYNDCGGGTKFGVLWTGGLAGHCYTSCGTQLTGAVGQFDSPDISTKYLITVESQGQASQAFFDTGNGGVSGKVGENVYVTWNGNLDSGRSCPDKDPFTPVYNQGKWRTVSTTAYNRYVTALAGIKSPQDISASTYIAKVDQADSYASAALNEVAFSTYRNSGSISNAVGVVELDDLLQFPVISAYIKASWLGIYTPVGRPSITSASSQCFSASSEGNIKSVIKNIGDERECFDVYADCGTGFSPLENKDVCLNPGASQTTYIGLSADASTRTEGQCTVYAVGLSETAQKTTNVCVDPQVVCQPQTTSCLSGNVVVCSNEGSGWVQSDECTEGCTIDNTGSAICREDSLDEPGLGTGCAWYDVGCHLSNLWQKANNTVMILASLISVLVFLLLTLIFRAEKSFEWKRNKWVLLGIALVVAVTVWFVTTRFWWLGILVAIGVIVWKVVK